LFVDVFVCLVFKEQYIILISDSEIYYTISLDRSQPLFEINLAASATNNNITDNQFTSQLIFVKNF
jgi:hypothetical protein